MRSIGIDNIVPGMKTARHIYAPGESRGIPLLAANVTVTESNFKTTTTITYRTNTD